MTTKQKDYQILYNDARLAGLEAGQKACPTPMIVGQPTTLFGNEIDYSKPTYHVASGVCGFAWVVVRPGNCSFAVWARKAGLAKKDYYGGVSFWVSDFGQSMERKEAYAHAFANRLSVAGIKAYAQSRMD